MNESSYSTKQDSNQFEAKITRGGTYKINFNKKLRLMFQTPCLGILSGEPDRIYHKGTTYFIGSLLILS